MQPARYFPIDLQRDSGGRLVHPMPGGYEGLRPDPERNGPADALHFQIDDSQPRYLVEKRRLLSDPATAGQCRLSLPGHETVHERARAWMAECLAREHPGRFQPRELHRLEAISQCIQEDVVLLTRSSADDASRAVATHIDVCFPSGWRPESILGRDFEQIHARVPGHDMFHKDASPQHDPDGRGEQRRRHAQVLFGAERVRYVWTLTSDGQLDRHPDRLAAGAWDRVEDLHLRVERQTVVPLLAAASGEPGEPREPEQPDAQDVCVFLIRVHMYPVHQLSARQCGQLRDAIADMPAAVARYKGLLAPRSTILSMLSTLGPPVAR